MDIQDKLASSLNRRDQGPNIELAERIVRSSDTSAVNQLVAVLEHGKRPAQNDAIKVLYEVGEHAPALIAKHAAAFLKAMNTRNNRLTWGALTALACISRVNPAVVHKNIKAILAAADKGSVIAKDQAMYILCVLASTKEFATSTAPTLVARLEKSAENQFPMYAEMVCEVALPAQAERAFCRVLKERAEDMPTAAKKKRVERVVRKVTALHEVL